MTEKYVFTRSNPKNLNNQGVNVSNVVHRCGMRNATLFYCYCLSWVQGLGLGQV